MRKIGRFEPWIFLVFGIFHLHRIWGLLDRTSYAAFWIGVMERRDWSYYLLMGALALPCVLGIGIFLRNLYHNYWWRWIYILGGGYVLFDLFAIMAGWGFWHKLILKMYDTTAPWWNFLWSAFVVMGGAVFALGVGLFYGRRRQINNREDLTWQGRKWSR